MAPAGIGSSVEGVHAVTAALHAGRVHRITVERRRLSALESLVDEAGRQGVLVDVVEDVRPLASTDVPQGVIASAEPIPVLDLAEAAMLSDPAALIVLDHVEDPHNVGAIARSARAAGVGAIVASDRRAAPFGPTAFKAAAGALEDVGVVMVHSIADAIVRLKRLEVWSVGLSADADRSLFGLDLLAEPVAVVVGAEGRGLSRLVSERADILARIPMLGMESLNASVASALALFEIGRVRGLLR